MLWLPKPRTRTGYRTRTVGGLTLAAGVLVTLLAAAAAPVARRAPSRGAAPDPALVAEVRALNKAMTDAFRGDPAAVARFYADDARIVGPRRETVRGRAAIDRYWLGIRGAKAWRLEVVEVGGSRTEAYQVGVSSLTSVRPDGTESTYTCDFVVIWKRQPNGTLKIVLDLYT